MRSLAKLLILVLFPLSLEAGEWDSVVQISGTSIYKDEKGYTKIKSWLGTGTCVYNGKVQGTTDDVSFILTNSHIAPDQDTLYTIVGEKSVYTDVTFLATVPEEDRLTRGDLGLLMVRGLFIPKVEIAKSDPEPGTQVHQYSYAWGGPCYQFGGHFLGHKMPGGTVDPNTDYGDFTVYPGCSGSGVFLPGGRLFGVCFATNVKTDAQGKTIKDAQGRIIPIPPCMMVSNEKVRAFLNKEAPFILKEKVSNEKGPTRPFGL